MALGVLARLVRYLADYPIWHDEAFVAASLWNRSFAELARWIGEGFASLASVVDPDVIVVGGGVSESYDLDVEAIVAAFGPAESGHGHRPVPRISKALLGNNAGLIGAADLARAAL